MLNVLLINKASLLFGLGNKLILFSKVTSSVDKGVQSTLGEYPDGLISKGVLLW